MVIKLSNGNIIKLENTDAPYSIEFSFTELELLRNMANSGHTRLSCISDTYTEQQIAEFLGEKYYKGG